VTERERFDVLYGYALGLLLSTLRGVRATLRRLIGEDDDVRAMRPPHPAAAGGRNTGSGAEAIRRALATTPPLPGAYADDRLILIARDPWTLAASWDLAPSAPLAEGDRLVVRVYDVTLLAFDDARAWRQQDHEARGAAGSCLVPLDHAGGEYRAEIALRRADGSIAVRARSSTVTVPRTGSGHDPERWMHVRAGREPLANAARLVPRPPSAPLSAPRSARIPWQLRATSSEEHHGRGG
jgi:hypothetical protein